MRPGRVNALAVALVAWLRTWIRGASLAPLGPSVAHVHVLDELLGVGERCLCGTQLLFEVVQFAATLVVLAVGFWAFDFGVTGALAVVTASRFGALLGYLVAVRLPPSSRAFSPTIAPGPISATSSPSISTTSTPSRTR